MVSRIRPGTTINIALVRNGAEKRVKTVIAEPPALVEPESPQQAAKPTLGIEATVITADAAKKAGLAETAHGITVKSLDGGSASAESELRPGDVILRINDITIGSPEDFKKATDGLKTGEIVRILWAGRRGPSTTRRVANVKID
jgi:S1-C subfamily serine protease